MSHNTASLVPWIASFTDSFSAAGASTLTLSGFGLSLGTDVDFGSLGSETGRAYTATDASGNGNLVISLTVATLPSSPETVQVKVSTGGVPAVQSPLSVQHGQFDPTSLASLQVWFDAADASSITKDASDLVSQWSDKSGNGYHAAQSTAANQPKYFASGGGIGQKHIRWGLDGDWHYLDAPSANWATVSSGGFRNASIFIVFKWVSGGAANLFSDIMRLANADSISTFDGAYDVYGTGFWSNGFQCLGGTATSALPDKVLGGWMLTDSGFVTRINGSVDATDSTSAGTSASTTTVRLGGNYAVQATDFEVSEILIFNTELTGSDLSDVEGYLNSKWSIY